MRKKTGMRLPEAVVEQIYDRTGGVPLFVEEFTKMVQESGMLDQAGDGGARPRSCSRDEIPATLQDLVTARLDRMEGDREVAQLAATLGREFSYELLAAVAAMDEADAPGGAGQAGAGGDPVPEGPAAPVLLHLQARPARRRVVQRAGQGQAPAVPPANRRGDGGAVSRRPSRPSRSCSPTTSPKRA